MSGALDLSAGQIGQLAAVEAVGGISASLTAPFWITRYRWRLIAMFSLTVMIIGALATAVASSFDQIIIARLLSSVLGAGPTYALGVAAISTSNHPDRDFAIGGGIQSALPAMILFAAPAFSGAQGLHHIALLLACLFAAGLFATPNLRHHGNHPVAAPKVAELPTDVQSGPARPLAFLLLISAFSLAACTQAYWAFSERVGASASLSHSFVGQMLGMSTLISILSSVVAARLANRVRRDIIFSVGACLFLFCLILVLMETKSWSFGISVIAVSFFGVLLTPFQFGAITEADPSGRSAVLTPAAQSLGVMTGPLAAGYLISGESYILAALASAVFLVIAWLTFQLAHPSRNRPTPKRSNPTTPVRTSIIAETSRN